MLILDRKRGSSVRIGPVTVHVLMDRHGSADRPRRDWFRIGIDAPADFLITRSEVTGMMPPEPLKARDALRMVESLQAMLTEAPDGPGVSQAEEALGVAQEYFAAMVNAPINEE